MLDAATITGLLADEHRLRVVSALVMGASTPAEIAYMTRLEPRAVWRALTRLTAGGLVDEHPGPTFSLALDRIREAARSAHAGKPETPLDENEAVLGRFLRGGKLTHIPAAHGKRLVVLDFLAQQFEPGRNYPESDVNTVLGEFHDDVASLRRYLVDDGFLERRDSFYWRVGGSFDTA
jgi:hypothetical protein